MADRQRAVLASGLAVGDVWPEGQNLARSIRVLPVALEVQDRTHPYGACVQCPQLRVQDNLETVPRHVLNVS